MFSDCDDQWQAATDVINLADITVTYLAIR